MPSGKEQIAYKKRLEEIGEVFKGETPILETLEYMRGMALQLARLEFENKKLIVKSEKIHKKREDRQLLF